MIDANTDAALWERYRSASERVTPYRSYSDAERCEWSRYQRDRIAA